MNANNVPILECYFLTGLGLAAEDDRRAHADGTVPTILDSFPSADRLGGLVESLAPFCFPDGGNVGIILTDTDNHRGQLFTFALTDELGTRRYGYCRYVPNSSPWPFCFCVVSRFLWQSAFSSMLGILCDLFYNGATMAIPTFLERVLECQIPPPGTKMYVEIPPRGDVATESWCLLRQSAHTTDLDLGILLRCFSVDQVMTIFESLLCERRVIISHSSLAVLTGLVLAAVSVLEPFTWQCPIIPVVPRNLLDLVAAPCSFIYGVPASELECLKEFPLDEIVVCDAVAGTIVVPQDVKHLSKFRLPRKSSTRLRAELQKVSREAGYHNLLGKDKIKGHSGLKSSPTRIIKSKFTSWRSRRASAGQADAPDDETRNNYRLHDALDEGSLCFSQTSAELVYNEAVSLKVSQCFADFFVSALSKYRRAIVSRGPDRHHPHSGFTLDKNVLMATYEKSISTAAFLQTFVGTQMFDSFCMATDAYATSAVPSIPEADAPVSSAGPEGAAFCVHKERQYDLKSARIGAVSNFDFSIAEVRRAEEGKADKGKECPGCGARLSPSETKCTICGTPRMTPDFPAIRVAPPRPAVAVQPTPVTSETVSPPPTSTASAPEGEDGRRKRRRKKKRRHGRGHSDAVEEEEEGGRTASAPVECAKARDDCERTAAAAAAAVALADSPVHNGAPRQDTRRTTRVPRKAHRALPPGPNSPQSIEHDTQRTHDNTPDSTPPQHATPTRGAPLAPTPSPREMTISPEGHTPAYRSRPVMFSQVSENDLQRAPRATEATPFTAASEPTKTRSRSTGSARPPAPRPPAPRVSTHTVTRMPAMPVRNVDEPGSSTSELSAGGYESFVTVTSNDEDAERYEDGDPVRPPAYKEHDDARPSATWARETELEKEDEHSTSSWATSSFDRWSSLSDDDNMIAALEDVSLGFKDKGS